MHRWREALVRRRLWLVPARKKQVGTAFVQDNDVLYIRDDPVHLNLGKSYGNLQCQCLLASL